MPRAEDEGRAVLPAGSSAAPDAAGRGVSVANTLALPCRASAELRIAGAADLRAAQALGKRLGVPLLPLGQGSNVVLPRCLDAVVLSSADDSLQVLDTRGDSVDLRVGAAHGWHDLVLATLARGLYGLENLALIPGLVGAAPIQNIGAYGRELSEFVIAVHGFDLVDGGARSLDRDACAFGYRHSVFKERLRDRFLVTAVDLRLSRTAALRTDYPALAARLAEGGYPMTPAGVCEAVVALRRERLPDPATHPNAGSFFTNPVLAAPAAARFATEHPAAPLHEQPDGTVKLSAAWLIEQCGLRGYARGGVRVSSRHALVLEHGGGADQAELLALVGEVQARVAARFGVHLEPEPRIYPEAPAR